MEPSMGGCTCSKAKMPSTATRNATKHIVVYYKAITEGLLFRRDRPKRLPNSLSSCQKELDTTRTSLRSPCASKQCHTIAADEVAESDTIVKEKES
jgi:hypothetical protein